ncbi:MAG: T9SS type A sorting domain-containing protein [Bacteroidia bacterium]|nr:T9SS type A sorting domain-containing protein [Bacteroidia bacterium]
MKRVLILLMLTFGLKSYATIYQVGSAKTYVSPNALYTASVVLDGDTIEIDAETYTGQPALAVWQSNDLLIRGVGGRPHLVANGEYIWGKGIWVVAGDNIVVENIEFSGAAVPSMNGAGIRLDGAGLTVRDCYFHDNENGILVTNNAGVGDLLIEFSEFDNNGFGDGLSHNLYVGKINKLTFRFNNTHHAKIGHNLKSRATENYILYNRLMDEQSGTSSRLIDLPNGGFSIVMGNLIMQGDNAPNKNMVGYGLEGLVNTPPHELHIINNTFVNKRVASCTFVDIESGTTVANVSNNIFAGDGVLINGTTTTMNTNYVDATISNVGFVNEAGYDYHLNSNSPALDYGTPINPVNGYSLTPDSIYEHPTNFGLRSVVNSIIDAGAYEYGVTSSIPDLLAEELLIYPNPTKGILTVEREANQIKKLSVFNALGSMISSTSNSNTVDLSTIHNGIYFLRVEMKDGKDIVQPIIKE